MTYETLTADVDLMRAGNDDVLSEEKYNDATLLLLHKTAAKIEMKLDIEQALSIEYDDDGTTLDGVTDKHSTRLSRALSFKQLCLFYQKNDTGADTKNRVRWEMYQKLYNRERLQFGSLSLTVSGANVDSVQIWR